MDYKPLKWQLASGKLYAWEDNPKPAGLSHPMYTWFIDSDPAMMVNRICVEVKWQGQKYASKLHATDEALAEFGVEHFKQQIVMSLHKRFPHLPLFYNAQVPYAKGGIVQGDTNDSPHFITVYHGDKYLYAHDSMLEKVLQQEISNASRDLPGVDAEVEFPCDKGVDCHGTIPDTLSLWSGVIKLNDKCKWSREKIADWIDELHDAGTINAEFQPWEESTKQESFNLAKQESFNLDDWKDVGYTTDVSLLEEGETNDQD